jgi:uncharacterized repeat protein (TIGR01451 family)
VVFSTFASNLGGNAVGTSQVMLRDLDSGALVPISAQGDDFLERSNDARITPDGRFVVWDESSSTLLPRAIVRLDRTTGTREIESVNDAGQAGNDDSSVPDLSSDGRLVAFTSMASNLVTDDTNGRLDVFVRDTVAHTTRRVSVGSNGEQGDLDSFGPAVDSDGQVIAFTSDSSTFVSETQTFFANDVFVRDARPPADLALGLVDSPDPATVRGTLTYTATTTNGGPTNATGVTLVGALPANTTFVSASSDVHPGGQGQDRRHDHVPGRQPERRRLGNGADRRAADSYRDADLLAQGLRRPAGPEPREQQRHGHDDRQQVSRV